MVEISPADTSLLTVMMSAAATDLPKVVTVGAATKYISPNLRGFEDRMKYENGYYIDEPTLRKNESRMLSNLLETKPGVQISRGMANSAYLWRSPRCTNGGPPAVYLDGVPLSPTPTRDPAQAAASGGNTRTVFGLPSVESPGDPDLLPFNLSEINISDLAGVEWYPDSEIIPAEFAHTSGRCGALLLWTREK